MLERSGCGVGIAEDATYGGQPPWNAGHADAAAKVARTTLEALATANTGAVVVPTETCATMMRIFSNVVLVTGPNRSADIELRLTVGVPGLERVLIALL